MNTLAVSLLSAGHVSRSAILVWVALSLVVTGYRLYGLSGYRLASRAAGADGPTTGPWLRTFLFGCWGAGAIWGLAPIVLFPTHSLPHQIFLAFVLSGVAAGSITTLSPLPQALLPFSLALTLPIAVRFVTSGSSLGQGVGLLTLVFLAFSVSSGLKAHASIVESLTLRIRLARSERLLQDTGALLHVGGWALDIPTQKLEWTREVFRIHEVPGDQQPHLDQALDFYPPRARERIQVAVDTCMTEGTPWDLQTEFITAKGNRRWVRSLGHAEFRHGKPVRLAGSFQDITNEKQTETALVAAKDLAEAATRAKSQFLATMSHEIRTPMNGVLGLSKLLLATPLNQEQQRLVEGIHASGETLLSVINDVLDFSRIEAGRMEILRQPFDLQNTISTVVQLLKPAADLKQLGLKVSVSGKVPSTFVGDANRIRQVLLNLLGNAVKFTEQGGITLTVSTPQTSAGLVRVVFAVADTGPGIAPELQDKLFRPFSQVDESAARRFGGTGLGLAISRQLVELMGGTINVTSKVEHGSVFSFELPLQATSVPASPTGTYRRVVSQLAWKRPPRLLVVEDNEINQLVAQQLLEKLGGLVQVASSGSEGLAKWKAGPYDLIFMDCQMPGMDGYEATRAIRATEGGADIPIVALTANVFQEDIDRCLQAGMTAHMSKPVSMQGLATGLECHLSGLIQSAGAEVAASESHTTRRAPGTRPL